jgi:DNA/RNA endonuclease G (NUC1)
MFSGSHMMIGNGVHVPTHFYKVVYDPNNQDAIAFLVPHRKISKSELPAFIVSVDEVERRSGFDFNNLLDDSIEDDMEDDVGRCVHILYNLLKMQVFKKTILQICINAKLSIKTLSYKSLYATSG